MLVFPSVAPSILLIWLQALGGQSAASKGAASLQGALTYDPADSIEITGEFHPSVCVGFGCNIHCPFYPPVDVEHEFPLDSCGASVSQAIPSISLQDGVASNGATASASVTADGVVTAYAGGDSFGAIFDVQAILAASAVDNACNAQPAPPLASATFGQSVTVEIPFLTSGGECAFTVFLMLTDCSDAQATGSWSISGLGPWSPVIATGPIDTVGHTGQEFIPPGSYLFRATLTSSTELGDCAPCGGAFTPPNCTHHPYLRVGVGVSSCLGDILRDGRVGTPDLLALLAAWGPCPPLVEGECPVDCPADLNGDRTVDNQDLLLLLANWGFC